ncbi:MAG TPA: hypothetical protein VNL71_10220 [Chloroflexota bacterium]|nr:hypothetical protein [Chloroflexota bacterium]
MASRRSRSPTLLTMRVDQATHQAIGEIAQSLGTSMRKAIAPAVETYRRQIIVEDANSAYARLRADATASEAFDSEHAMFDHAFRDGIGDDPYPL